MSLVSVPFVDTGADTALHIAASVVMIGTLAIIAYGFWKLHELPIHKAHKRQHQQIGLITALTWIGFLWHWVWVVAVFIAFVDGEQAVRRIKEIWHGTDDANRNLAAVQSPAANSQDMTSHQEDHHA